MSTRLRHSVSVTAILAMMAACTVPAMGSTATTYTGSLTYTANSGSTSGGLAVSPGDTNAEWYKADVSIAWSITNTAPLVVGDTTFAWRYDYSFGTNGSGGISAVDIEVSENCTMSDLYLINPPGGGIYIAPKANLHLPDTLQLDPNPPKNYFLLLDAGGTSPKQWNVSFYSNRAPVWGDVFLKDGTGNYAYNADFSQPDPTTPPSNEQPSRDGGLTMAWNILRPDGTDIPPPVVPEPLTVGSIFLAIGGIGAYMRKRVGSA